jgi:hypothetical protein
MMTMEMVTFEGAMAELRAFVASDRQLHFVVLDGYPLTLELRDACVCVGVKTNGHTHRALPVGASATLGSLSPRCPFPSMRLVAKVTRHVRERARTPAATVASRTGHRGTTTIPSYAEVVICMRPVRVELSQFVATTADDPAWPAHNTNVQRTVVLAAAPRSPARRNREWTRRSLLTPSPCVDHERKPMAFLSGCALPGSVVRRRATTAKRRMARRPQNQNTASKRNRRRGARRN